MRLALLLGVAAAATHAESGDPSFWLGGWAPAPASTADFLVDQRQQSWLRLGHVQPLPALSPADSCDILSGFDALLVLGDSNTRHLFLALLRRLGPDPPIICPTTWHFDFHGKAERPFLAGLQRTTGRVYSPASAADLQEISHALCRHCLHRYASSEADVCKYYFPADHTKLPAAARPCDGKLDFFMFGCGECQPEQVDDLFRLAARYSRPLVVAGFGVHFGYDVAKVQRSMAPLLAHLAAPRRTSHVVWLEPLSRKESMIAETYLVHRGQSNDRAERLNAAVRALLAPFTRGNGVQILQGSQVSPGAETPDGTHLLSAGNAVRATLFLLGVEHAVKIK